MVFSTGGSSKSFFEKKHFHWITHKALKELTTEGVVLTTLRTTPGNNSIRLYWSKRRRYATRVANALIKQVDKHSNPQLAKAIGHHAETLFGIAAAKTGFALTGPDVKAFKGKKWTFTDHNLDWIFERDGVAGGVEIKNTWAYIDREEIEWKIRLCRVLGVKPLFIMRAAAKSYIENIRQQGGFSLIFRTQYFPLNHTEAVRKLSELHFPVATQTVVPEQDFRRFVTWHEAHLGDEVRTTPSGKV
jgi:hypothetical protein